MPIKQTKVFCDPKQLPKLGSSDHDCALMQQGLGEKTLSIKRRDTRTSCIRDFGHWITSFSWDEVFAQGSCENKFDLFNQTLSAAVDRYLPIKVSNMHSSDKPWLTSHVKAFIAKRQKALTDFGKDSPTFPRWWNKVQKTIRNCKRLFYEGQVKSSIKSTNVNRWRSEVKNLSGVSTKDGQWFKQLVDPNTTEPVGPLLFSSKERYNENNRILRFTFADY